MTVSDLHTLARQRGLSVRREYHETDVYYHRINREGEVNA